MRQMVALSLLQQQSASERLRGVSWAYQSEPTNNEVLTALVGAVRNDPNINVRLAAVDALGAFAQNPQARQALREALPRESTPIVQVALIDLLVDLQEQEATPALQEIVSTEGINDGVREQALWALERLRLVEVIQ